MSAFPGPFRSAPPAARPPLPPVVRGLLISLAVVYALELVALHWLERPDLVGFLWLLPRDVVERGWAWQVVSYMWLHDPASPWHLLLNALGLYVFGAPLGRRWGTAVFLRFYLLSGALAGLVVLATGWWSAPDVPTIGCSGAVFALAAAFGILYADAHLFLFGVIPMRARSLLLLLLAMVLLDWLMNRQGISVAGHLGGLAAGALLVTGFWKPWKLVRYLRERFGHRSPVVRFERRERPGPDDPDRPEGGPRWVN